VTNSGINEPRIVDLRPCHATSKTSPIVFDFDVVVQEIVNFIVTSSWCLRLWRLPLLGH